MDDPRAAQPTATAGVSAGVAAAAGGPLDEVVRHVVGTTALSPGVAARVVQEVVSYLSESVEQFVRRRHRELQAAGLVNAEIFARLAAEIPLRRFAAGDVTERRLRRIVYG